MICSPILNSLMLPSAKKCAVCGSIFDAPRLRTQLAAIETRLADPALWSNAALSQPIMRDRKRIEAQLANDAELERRTGDIDAYFELARDAKTETDPEVAAILAELEKEIKALAEVSEKMESRTMLSGETDPLNAIVTVHPGAGGTESQDWAEMLMRM